MHPAPPNKKRPIESVLPNWFETSASETNPMAAPKTINTMETLIRRGLPRETGTGFAEISSDSFMFASDIQFSGITVLIVMLLISSLLTIKTKFKGNDRTFKAVGSGNLGIPDQTPPPFN